MSCNCYQLVIQGKSFCQECMPDETNWLVPMSEKPDPFLMDRHHAYITPDGTVYVLDHAGMKAVPVNGTGGGAGFDPTELQNMIDNMKQKVEALENKEDKDTDTVYDDSELREKVETNTGDLGAVKNDLAQAKKDLEALKEKQDNDTIYDDKPLKDKIKELSDKIKELEGPNGDGNKTDVDAIKKEVEALKEAVAGFKDNDTKYTAGDNVSIDDKNVVSVNANDVLGHLHTNNEELITTKPVGDNTYLDLSGLKKYIDGKATRYTAGENITITGDNNAINGYKAELMTTDTGMKELVITAPDGSVSKTLIPAGNDPQDATVRVVGSDVPVEGGQEGETKFVPEKVVITGPNGPVEIPLVFVDTNTKYSLSKTNSNNRVFDTKIYNLKLEGSSTTTYGFEMKAENFYGGGSPNTATVSYAITPDSKEFVGTQQVQLIFEHIIVKDTLGGMKAKDHKRYSLVHSNVNGSTVGLANGTLPLDSLDIKSRMNYVLVGGKLVTHTQLSAQIYYQNPVTGSRETHNIQLDRDHIENQKPFGVVVNLDGNKTQEISVVIKRPVIDIANYREIYTLKETN